MSGITNTPPQLSPPLSGTASSGAAPIGMLDEASTITEIEDAEIDSPTLNLKPNNPAEQLVPLKMPATLPSGGSFQVSQTQVTADIYDFMQVFQQVAQQMRSSARVQRTSEMQAQVTSLQGAAQEMRTAAADRYKAAITQAITQIVSGAVQVGMAGFSAFKSAQGMRAEAKANAELKSIDSLKGPGPAVKQSDIQAAIQTRNAAIAKNTPPPSTAPIGPVKPSIKASDLQTAIAARKLDIANTPPRPTPSVPTTPSTTPATPAMIGPVQPLAATGASQAAPATDIKQSLINRTEAAKELIKTGQDLQRTGKLVSDSIQGTGSVINGVGAFTAAGFSRDAAEADADKANLDTEAKMHENAQQQANETMQQMMDVIRDVREKLQSIEQANLETSRSIARNI